MVTQQVLSVNQLNHPYSVSYSNILITHFLILCFLGSSSTSTPFGGGATGGSTFGQSSTTPFGQPSQPQSSGFGSNTTGGGTGFSFGSQPSNTQATGGFGSSAGTTGGGLFGQSSASKPAFGSSTTTRE